MLASNGRRHPNLSVSEGRTATPLLDLPDKNSHVVVCVRFRWSMAADGSMNEEKFVTTAYFQVF